MPKIIEVRKGGIRPDVSKLLEDVNVFVGIEAMQVYKVMYFVTDTDTVLRSREFIRFDAVGDSIHHTKLDSRWDLHIRGLSERTLLATTHSMESIRAMLAVAERYGLRCALFRAEEVDNDLFVVAYNHDELKTAVQSGIEVR